MAKIAVESGLRVPVSRRLASGDGWAVWDVVCAAGPRDRPFEEQHSTDSIAVVVGGTFGYRSPSGRELMTPGSLLLGNAGDSFVCGHEHGTGDRCISFSYAPELFDGLAGSARFQTPRLPPLRELAPLVAKAAALPGEEVAGDVEALAIQLAAEAIEKGTGDRQRSPRVEAGPVSRVARVVRLLENELDASLDLAGLARAAGLSKFHFLRTFVRVTGATPHQYVLRARLRRAAVELQTGRTKIVEVALGCGFGDVSSFNRAFRAEFGMSPRVYRSRA